MRVCGLRFRGVYRASIDDAVIDEIAYESGSRIAARRECPVERRGGVTRERSDTVVRFRCSCSRTWKICKRVCKTVVCEIHDEAVESGLVDRYLPCEVVECPVTMVSAVGIVEDCGSDVDNLERISNVRRSHYC